MRLATTLLLLTVAPVAAQDDITTQNGSNALKGAWVTGPASNPLSFLNGPAYRTDAIAASYLLPDFRPASQLNTKLPFWIRFGIEERFRIEHNSGEMYALNRLRLQMVLQPVAWMKVVAQSQDARTFFQQSPLSTSNPNRWDLKLAYAEFGNPETSWISVRAGRQLINYNNTLIANSEWRNQARSYDAVVTNLHTGVLSLGIFAASVVVPLADGLSHHQQGNNIYGLYGAIDNPIPNSRLEPFVLWRVQPLVAVEGGASGRQDEKAYGVRFKGQVATRLDYSAEIVLERGTDSSNKISASGFTLGAGYRFSTRTLRPRAFTQFDYASGDSNPTDGRHGTFDTMFPTNHDRLGISDQFGWQNICAARGGITIEPRPRWTITAQLVSLWLANPADGAYNGSGSLIARDRKGQSGTHVGEELDVFTWVELNRHVNFGVGLGHIIPGRFLALQAPGRHFDTPYLAINFKDNGRSK